MLQNELNAIKLKREMEKMLNKNAVNIKRLNEILITLRTTEIDLEILRKTKIGVCVNNIRKTYKNSKEITELTTELIRKWKKIAKEKFHSKSESESVGNLKAATSTDSPVAGVTIVDESGNEFQNYDKRYDYSESPKNEFRRKSIELLTEALKTTTDATDRNSNKEFMRIAAAIENCIFYQFPDPKDKKYKAKVRSRVMNLRDKNNPDFRRNVVNGFVTPREAASMSVAEMASVELKELRKSIEQETMKERELQDSTATLGKSVMFCCPECHCRDTSYTIFEDRLEGEFEPVAVSSIVCNRCGHRWKSF